MSDMIIAFLMACTLGGAMFWYLESCIHNWVKIDSVTYSHSSGEFHSRVLVYQCTRCKKIKKTQY